MHSVWAVVRDSHRCPCGNHRQGNYIRHYLDRLTRRIEKEHLGASGPNRGRCTSEIAASGYSRGCPADTGGGSARAATRDAKDKDRRFPLVKNLTNGAGPPKQVARLSLSTARS